MNLLWSALNAPLCAVSKRWPSVIHAAEMDEIVRAWPLKGAMRPPMIVAPCGKRGLRFLAIDGNAVLWPPPTAAGDLKRCRTCWVATGRKRPRRPRSTTGRRP